jgi:hypothetical protein
MRSPKEMSKAIRKKKMADGGPVLDPDATESFVKGFKGVKEYAYGGRVLEERPGLDQGPEDCDLQDSEIERQGETAEQNDDNIPKADMQGEHESNANEDHTEEREQPLNQDRNANHEDHEKELLRNARKDRIRKRMRE